MKSFSFSLSFNFLFILMQLSSLNLSAANPISNEPVKPLHHFNAGVRAADLLQFTSADYSKMTGKKMNYWQKLSFNVMKIKLRKELKKNPDLLLNDFYKENKRMGTGWIILLAVISTLLLLLLIFAIAYTNQ